MTFLNQLPLEKRDLFFFFFFHPPRPSKEVTVLCVRANRDLDNLDPWGPPPFFSYSMVGTRSSSLAEHSAPLLPFFFSSSPVFFWRRGSRRFL